MDKFISWARPLMPYLITAAIILCVYNSWFLSSTSVSADLNISSRDHFERYTHPYLWDSDFNNGFGQYTIYTLPFGLYVGPMSYVIGLVSSNIYLNLKLIFLIPYLVLSFFSVRYLASKCTTSKSAQCISILLYLLNPYAIMLTSGGQMGVALAYAFAPFIVGHSLKICKNYEKKASQRNIFNDGIFGIGLAALIAFDSRIALVIIISISPIYAYTILSSINRRAIIVNVIRLIAITIAIVLSVHAYWLLPSILVKQVALPTGYSDKNAIDFFSFTRFAHAITWSHPNYPNNFFGEVREVTGIAFIIPIIAFLFLKNKSKLAIYFAIMAIVGAFLSKGVNPPFGDLYRIYYEKVPTGSLFRDSTKFYVLISIGYSILIGISIKKLLEFASQKKYSKTVYASLILILIAFILAWFPTLSGKIGGTFVNRNIPIEYKELNDLLEKDNKFGRVLWVPHKDAFGVANKNHQEVNLKELTHKPNCLSELCINEITLDNTSTLSRADLFNEIGQEVKWLEDSNGETLNEMGIQYIVVISDTDTSHYRFDRKFDPLLREEYKRNIGSLGYLDKIYDKNNVTAWKLKKQSYFITDEKGDEIQYKRISPVKYEITSDKMISKIKISQTFDKNWILKSRQGTITASAGKDSITTVFNVETAMNETYELYYKPQDTAEKYFVASTISIFLIGISTTYLFWKKI